MQNVVRNFKTTLRLQGSVYKAFTEIQYFCRGYHIDFEKISKNMTICFNAQLYPALTYDDVERVWSLCCLRFQENSDFIVVIPRFKELTYRF